MAAITLSRSEYLVILDILHAGHVFGLENHSLFPSDRAAHLELIHQGIRQLEARGLVRIEAGRHIIEQRLLEVVSVVARPQLVMTTIRDRAGIGGQLYLHYQARGEVVEQVLPDEDHYTLGQLPDITSAMDRVLHILDLPAGPCESSDPVAMARERFYQVHARLESGDRSAAHITLLSSGWPEAMARSYLATQAGQQVAGLVNLMAPQDGQPGEKRDLTLIHDYDRAWLVMSRPDDRDQLLIRQVNAASFRKALEKTCTTIQSEIQESRP